MWAFYLHEIGHRIGHRIVRTYRRPLVNNFALQCKWVHHPLIFISASAARDPSLGLKPEDGLKAGQPHVYSDSGRRRGGRGRRERNARTQLLKLMLVVGIILPGFTIACLMHLLDKNIMFRFTNVTVLPSRKYMSNVTSWSKLVKERRLETLDIQVPIWSPK